MTASSTMLMTVMMTKALLNISLISSLQLGKMKLFKLSLAASSLYSPGTERIYCQVRLWDNLDQSSHKPKTFQLRIYKILVLPLLHSIVTPQLAFVVCAIVKLFQITLNCQLEGSKLKIGVMASLTPLFFLLYQKIIHKKK